MAKSELVAALPAGADGGVAVLNADDPLVAAMAAVTAARVVSFGLGADADVRAEDVRLDDAGRPRFRLRVADRRGRRGGAAAARRAPRRQRARGRRGGAAARRDAGRMSRPRSARRYRAAGGGWRSSSEPTASRSSTTPTTPTPSRCGPPWPRWSRWPGAPAQLGGPGRDARARRGVRGRARGGRADWRAGPASGAWSSWGRAPGRVHEAAWPRAPSTERRACSCPTCPLPSPCWTPTLRPGDVVLVKASRSSGLEKGRGRAARGSPDEAGPARGVGRADRHALRHPASPSSC